MNSTITKITIGRLYNLGSYEHVRYELTAEVAEGESAFQVLSGMERILNALSPKKPPGVDSGSDLERKKFELKRMKALSQDDWNNQYAHFTKGTRAEVIQRLEEAYQEAKNNAHDWVLRCEKARELLEDLGGAAAWKDSKMDWEDYEEF